jgi:hypothetical protein
MTVAEFAAIRGFILRRGDRQTYCNMYNHNPHYRFDTFDVYLNPDIGQGNINCDPARSGFDELVIRDQNSEPQYYHVKEDRERARLTIKVGSEHTGPGARDLEALAGYVTVMLKRSSESR